VVDNLTALCYNYYISKETNKQLRKRNKMKNIVSILAVVAATATSVSAAETTQGVNWAGSAVDLPDACVFTKSVDGEMTYAENSDDQGGVWTVTKAAELKVSMRGALSSFTVVPDSDIERDGNTVGLTSTAHTKYAVTVDYTAGSMPTVITRSVRNKDMILTGGGMDVTSYYAKAESIELGSNDNFKHLNIKLGGTATMNYSGALIDNGEYTLGHTATCVQ
jgi:predicted small secreted protein